jgi:predicted nucleic acid-binding protein
MSKTYIFDASAILDFVEGGRGSRTVERLLQDALHGQCTVLVSVANWGEVLSVLWARRGEEKALSTFGDLQSLPMQTVPVDLNQALKAGEIKTTHNLPFLYCLTAALAELREGVLVTGDRDFEKLERSVHLHWLGRG